MDCFYVGDQRDRSAQILDLIKCEPDVILLVGGTDGGADEQLTHLIETLAIGLNLLDSTERPVVFFAGNAELRPLVKEALGEYTDVYRD